MFPYRTKNRKAISVVMTTLIILVASVVLGTGVVLYGTSLFQTGGQTQSISSQGVKLWANGTWSSSVATSGGPAGTIGWGAAAIRNNGDVLATVNTIQIRGVNVPYANWYVDSDPTRVGQNYQAQFNYTKNDVFGNIKGSVATGAGINNPQGTVPANCVNSGAGVPAAQSANPPSMLEIQENPTSTGNSPLCLAQQTGPSTLNPGAKMIVYFKMPLNLLGPIDSGSSVTANIYAGNVGGPTTITVANP
jgi:hypothetical protein